MIRSWGRVIALAAALTLVIATHRFDPDRWSGLARDVFHSLHGPGFATLTIALFWYLQARKRSSSNYFIAAATAFGTGILAEIVQIPGPREAEI